MAFDRGQTYVWGALAALVASAACQESDPFVLGGAPAGGSTTNSSGGSGGTGGAPFIDGGPEAFAALKDDLMTTCGSCHQTGGIADAPFLAAPDVYHSMLTWPGVVVKNPSESLVLTYPIAGQGHNGTNLDSAPNNLMDRVEAWLTIEAANISDPIDESPHLDPVTPILGFNAVYLSDLDSDLEGVAITFMAEELTPTTLHLYNLEVHATSQTGVHFVHPVFAVYPKGKPGNADPADNFSGLDQRIDVGLSAPLGSGILILTNWEEEAKLGIGFETIVPYSSLVSEGGGGQGGGGPVGGCTDVAEFDASAVPPLQQRCAGCHAGGNASAKNAVDMSELDGDTALACAQVLNRVDPAAPEQSQIFVVTDPNGNAAHPFKFGGVVGDYNTFKSDLTAWISSEAP